MARERDVENAAHARRREGDNELAYDMVFLAIGLAQIALGWLLV